jgi:hypothetical protein
VVFELELPLSESGNLAIRQKVWLDGEIRQKILAHGITISRARSGLNFSGSLCSCLENSACHFQVTALHLTM